MWGINKPRFPLASRRYSWYNAENFDLLERKYKMFDWLFSLPTALAEAAAPAAEGAAVAAEGAAAAEPNSAAALLQTFLPMVLIVAVFYFLLIRPQRKKDKKVKDMLANLKVGDRITTIGGIYGTIRALKDDTVTLLVGKDNVEMMFARWAIRGVEEVSIENEGEILN